MRKFLLFFVLPTMVLVNVFFLRFVYQETKVGNDPVVTLSPVTDGYRILFKGTRKYSLFHDPIAFLMSDIYETEYRPWIPRDAGKILGAEIPVSPKQYGYGGHILINGTEMTVNLTIESAERGVIDTVSWNGTYIVVRTEGVEPFILLPTFDYWENGEIQ